MYFRNARKRFTILSDAEYNEHGQIIGFQLWQKISPELCDCGVIDFMQQMKCKVLKKHGDMLNNFAYL